MEFEQCHEILMNSSNYQNSSYYYYTLNSSVYKSLEDEYGHRIYMAYPDDKGMWKTLEITDCIKIFAYAVVIIGGLLGNISIILTVARNQCMRTIINFYVMNLAVADALICIICMLLHALNTVTTDRYILGKFMCKFESFAGMTFLICSVLTLSAISCDRFVAIAFPLRVRTTKHRTSLVVIVIWTISIILSVPILIVNKAYVIKWDDFVEYYCIETWPVYWYYDEATSDCVPKTSYLQNIYMIILSIALYFLPTLIMVSAYSWILWRVQMTNIPGEHHEANVNAHSRTKRKVNKMVFFVLIVFIICWTPRQVIGLYNVIADSDYYSVSFPDWLGDAEWASYYLSYANSFVNPIIYGWFNKTFRKGLCTALRCGCSKRQIGRSVRSIRKFSTRVTSTHSKKSAVMLNNVERPYQESDMELTSIHLVRNGDIAPTASDTSVAIL